MPERRITDVSINSRHLSRIFRSRHLNAAWFSLDPPKLQLLTNFWARVGIYTLATTMAAPTPHLNRSVEETKVEYRRLGNSGLRISVPILGSMNMGSRKTQKWAIEEDEVWTSHIHDFIKRPLFHLQEANSAVYFPIGSPNPQGSIRPRRQYVGYGKLVFQRGI